MQSSWPRNVLYNPILEGDFGEGSVIAEQQMAPVPSTYSLVLHTEAASRELPHSYPPGGSFALTREETKVWFRRKLPFVS